MTKTAIRLKQTYPGPRSSAAKKHTSLYKARNLAINESNGELLAFIDTDDLWEKNKLELQIPLFKDSKIALVYSNLWIMKNNLGIKKKFIKTKSPCGFIYEKLLEEYNVGIITAIFDCVFVA